MAVVARGFCKYFQPKCKVFTHALNGSVHRFQVLRTSYYDNQVKHGNDYEYEVSFNPNEWKFVERLIPIRTVPDVNKKEKYPSGWRPPTEEAKNHPYFPERSKNHMLPVYLKIGFMGTSRRTLIRHIRGDIWKLHDDLQNHLESVTGKVIHTRVNEGNSVIEIKGDYVYYVEQWMLMKGF